MKVYIDCNDKTQRKEMVDYVHSKIRAAEKFGRCSSVIRLGWMKKIEAVMERQEEIIEELAERIAIMSEGGWHKITESTESIPKETDSVDVWVYGKDENGNPIVFRAIYSRWHFYDVSGRIVKECKITHWMYNKEPEPPKVGEP